MTASVSRNCSAFALLFVATAALPLACSKKDKEPAAQAAASLVAAAKPAPLAKCEPGPDGKCTPSARCSPTCQQIATPECLKCEAAGDCNTFANNCESPLLNAEERAVCYEILSCLETSNCFDGPDTTLGSCYCGKLPLKQCLAAPWSGPGAPDGVCRDVMLKGFPNAKAHAHVLGNMTTRVEHAAGAMALSRLNCQKIGYRKLCAKACGFGDIMPDPQAPAKPPEALKGKEQLQQPL
jgi:hypothetical protein